MPFARLPYIFTQMTYTSLPPDGAVNASPPVADRTITVFPSVVRYPP